MKRLEDKVAIVTGGARGLGRMFCMAMAREGAKIVVADILEEEAVETVGMIRGEGADASSIQVDITSEAETVKMAEKVFETYGKIDILVNNAAMLYGLGRRPFYEISAKEWNRLMTVNLCGAFCCCKAVYPFMKARMKGKIINLSSETAFTGSKGFIHYVTSKGGVISFTKSLAAELGSCNICVNALAPGFTDTASSRTITDDIDAYDTRQTPLGRLEKPEDLMGAMIFFASDESDFITGQTLVVDGGRYMH
jgi:NAD(P)-dependent dehydrogenase (short-subunit alcohol dehydrogenase family)